MFKKKIENIWFFTIIFCLIVIILILLFRQMFDLDIESKGVPIFPRDRIKKEEGLTLIFGGDVMLARTVEQKILKTGDWSLPFRKIYEEFEKTDLAFTNLESPIRDSGQATPNGSTVFRALPETIEGLKLAGIDIVSLANNHFGDQGKTGEEYTFEHLTNNNIEYCGAGNDFEEAHVGKILKVTKGNKEYQRVSIGYLCYAYPESMYIAGSNSPGMANMDIAQMKKDVNELKEKADFIVVSMHAGAEYTHNPGNFQINFARAAIDSGADLVVGHHPHVVQSTEKYGDGFIIYSLGNLVFDQMWSEETQQGVVALVSVEYRVKREEGKSKELRVKSIEFKPIHIYDYNQPDWADEEEAKEILGDMGLENGVLSFEE